MPKTILDSNGPGGGLATFRALPPEAASLNREASLAAFWCAVYGGNEGMALDRAEGRAEALLNNLHSRFEGDALDGGETEAFVRSLAHPGSPPRAEMAAAVARRRRAALLDPEERALLPLTLARAAAVFRAAGRAGEAADLETEALARAPQAWKRYLSHLARRAGSAGPGGTDRGK
ncbi:MAG: hypothetical protein ACP5VN_05660 [Acidobacteriota bacterium]